MSKEYAFQPYAVRLAWEQAPKVRQLVARNSWLSETVYAGAAERYASATKAVKSIIRLAVTPGIRAGILFEATEGRKLDQVVLGAAVGVGTIIGNQTICHPAEDFTLTGDDVDYWLDGRLADDPEAHAAAAHAMLVVQREALGPDAPVTHAFATVIPDAPHQPVGFSQLLDQLGHPAQLSVPGDDPYGIAKDGAELQLYVSPQALQLQA